MKMIVTSRAYQRAIAAPKGWSPNYDTYFTRRVTRRLPAEMLFDAVAQTAGLKPSYKITFSDKKTPRILQTRSPQDIDKSQTRPCTAHCKPSASATGTPSRPTGNRRWCKRPFC